MHEQIVGFSETGTLKDDSKIVETQQTMSKILADRIYSSGYLPVIDVDVQWTTHRNEEDDCYEFKITMYGVYVGEERSKRELAWSNGKTLRIR